MNFTAEKQKWVDTLPDLFRQVFAASEGEDEGKAIGALVTDLLSTTPDEDLIAAIAQDGPEPLGCILFSRLRFDQDPRLVFLMSPVAVRTDRQKSGIGQRLIRFGLDELRRHSVDFAVTYGDPKYYCKTGFHLITEQFARAPLPLSHPHGWLGQSLTGAEMAPFEGPSHCVSAFNRPELW
ncbi:GNAT family N-acetyltransferase [Ruegeria sp. Ofav3-42]|uniref:GNAT family N-acetyltransferase n=1 Tax=Ruegeria sp. Ofav3-42 TaxID=2917759 RepID=UPI001EF3ECF5|nr:N-acetyltransferase [Ruegeria sp. Ofav3-42]MCG7518101.1 N-acetyltransferase [Ruegeria sp. Ofav3-42]